MAFPSPREHRRFVRKWPDKGNETERSLTPCRNYFDWQQFLTDEASAAQHSGSSEDKKLVTYPGPLVQRMLLYNANECSHCIFLRVPKPHQHLLLPGTTKDCAFLLETTALKHALQKKCALGQLEGLQGAGCATTHKGQQGWYQGIRAEAGTPNSIYAMIRIFSSSQSLFTDTGNLWIRNFRKLSLKA